MVYLFVCKASGSDLVGVESGGINEAGRADFSTVCRDEVRGGICININDTVIESKRSAGRFRVGPECLHEGQSIYDADARNDETGAAAEIRFQCRKPMWRDE